MSFSAQWTALCACVPLGENDTVDWEGIEQTALRPILDQMAQTPQNPIYHGEGDVLAHTKLVCEALIGQREYRDCTDGEKQLLFVGALLHDIGKIRCTTVRDGELVSPRHSIVGANEARALLWREFGLSGSREAQGMREAICALVRYHSYPPFAMQDGNAERKLLQIAAVGDLVPDFSIDRLCLLERADVLGRISANADDYLSRIEYCMSLAEELGCLDKPHSFASCYSRRAYFLGKTDWRDADLYRDSWGEVILMSGLPGTGKDTWIAANHPDLPVVSLDAIRARLHIAPTKPQGPVIAAAHEEARAYLRRRQPFIWNATSVTTRLRANQIALFESYGASVRTVFLETAWEEELRRNAERDAVVPLSVIERMLSGLELPLVHECERVEWTVV